MTEYPISPLAKTVAYAFAAGCILFGTYAVYAGIRNPDRDERTIVLIVAVVLIPVGFFSYLNARRLRVTMDDRKLTVYGMFETSEILLDEIAGYRKDSEGDFFLLRKDSPRELYIPHNLRNRKALIAWITEHYNPCQ